MPKPDDLDTLEYPRNPRIDDRFRLTGSQLREDFLFLMTPDIQLGLGLLGIVVVVLLVGYH